MARKRDKLSDAEIEDALKALPQWSIVSGKLRREFKFENFVEAFAFMTKLALVSERLDHHPDWSNVYNRVEISLLTHDVGGISSLDFEWARAADAFFDGPAKE